jgi:hypothetical protein
MPSNWNINRDKISTSWGRRKLPWCQATTAKSRRWRSEIILSYTQRFWHGLLCATTCSDWKEDVPAPRRRRRQIRSKHWARDFLFCTLIAICHSIHPSSLSLAYRQLVWIDGRQHRSRIVSSVSTIARLPSSSPSWDTHTPARLHFGILPVSGGSLNSQKPSGSGSLNNSAPENLSSFSWGVPESEDRRFLILRCSRTRGPPVPVLWPILHQRTSVPSLEVFQNKRTAGSLSWRVPEQEDRRFLILRCSRIRGPPVPYLEVFQNQRAAGSLSWGVSQSEDRRFCFSRGKKFRIKE